MLTEELKHVFAIMDRTRRPAVAMPTGSGFYWNPRGSSLVLGASHATALAQAVRCELCLFGTSRLAFGLGFRFIDAIDATSLWEHVVYDWHRSDPAHWPVPTVADPRLIDLEERVLEVVVPMDAATGRAAVVRQLPLADSFAMALRTRISNSKESTYKVEWLASTVGQLDRSAAGGLDRVASSDGFVGDLLPRLESFLSPLAPSALA